MGHLVIQIIIILLGILLLLSVGSYYFVTDANRARKMALRRSLSQNEFKIEQIQQDIDYFYNSLERIHPEPYATITKTDFQAKLLELRNAAHTFLTRLEFYKRLASLISEMNDESVRLLVPETELDYHYSIGGRFFPFDVRIIDRKGYIARNYSNETRIREGFEIISINDVPFHVMQRRLAQLFSGSCEAQKSHYLSERFREMLYLFYGMAEKYKLVIQDTRANKTVTYEVEGKPFKKNRELPYAYQALEGGAGLLSLHGMSGDTKKFQKFLKRTFRTISKTGINHLVLDLRRNQGGASTWGNLLLEYLTNDIYTPIKHMDIKSSPQVKQYYLGLFPPMLRWLPLARLHPVLKLLNAVQEGESAGFTPTPVYPTGKSPQYKGKLTVLTGSGTSDSASLLAAVIHQLERGRLIGEPCGGMASSYGLRLTVHLPHTGLSVILPAAVIEGPSAGEVTADIHVKQTVTDLAALKDTVLETALRQ